MADVVCRNITLNGGAEAPTFVGRGAYVWGSLAAFGFSGAIPNDFLIVGGSWSQVPILQSVTSKDDRVSLVFDSSVNVGTPTFPAKQSAKDPTLTGTNIVSEKAFDLLWTLSVPALQSASSKDDRVSLVFDIPVSPGTPSFPAKQSSKDPTLTGTNIVNSSAFDILWTLVPSSITVVSTISTLNRITLTMSASVGLTLAGQNPTNWTITTTDPGAVAGIITAISVVGSLIIFTTNELTTGKAYTVHGPALSIYNLIDGASYTGSYDLNFTGQGQTPYVVSIYATSANTFVAIFSEVVNQASAENPANYSINPVLPIISIVQITPLQYKFTTGPQTPGVSYSVTITGIIDSANNPI